MLRTRWIDYGAASLEAMMKRRPSVVRVAMVKRVAATWLQEHAKPEYRITVYASSDDIKNLPSLLRAFRDHRVRLSGIIPAIPDLGIEQNPENITLWSGNREGMIKLDEWLTKRGCETTGIW